MSTHEAILPTPASHVLTAEGVSFSHDGVSPVFEHISLTVQRREIVALLGASGCGKSTLLRLLAGLATPGQGAVHFLDQPLTQPHPRSALIFQQASLLPWLTVFGNAAFGLDFRHQPRIRRQQRDQRVQAALDAVGLTGREHAWPAQLSGGMAQRVALARALAREPALLFADEPFSALDAITRADMQRLLIDLVHRWHTAVLLVTHDIDEALLVADRVILMGGQPGHLLHSWDITVPRPREEHPDALAALRRDMLSALKNQAAPAAFSSLSPA